jgi:beta-lactam-binding protein with PASTA domain
VKRKKLAAAKNAIRAAGCTVGQITRKKSKKVKPGRVIKQKLAAGTTVTAGTAIALVVSRR